MKPHLTLIVSRVVHGACFMLCSSLLVIAAGLGIIHLRGQQLLSVQSASMVPTFRRGDALIVSRTAPATLQVGDIVSYQRNGVVVSHRLIDIDHRNGLITTKGDANRKSDEPLPVADLLGRATAVAPSLGTVLDAAHNPIALIGGIYLPAGVVVISEIRRLAVVYARPGYRLSGYHR